MPFLWLKKVWSWCKINWKFLLGVSIPIIVGIILRKNNAAEVFKKASETRKKELDILNKSHQIEQNKKSIANQQHREKISNILQEHDADIEEIERKEKLRIKEINSAEKATQALKEKLEDK